MSTSTALIVVGRSHPDDGGIVPSHLLQLDRGDRPVWRLSSLAPAADDPEPDPGWVPTAAHPLEDALLMVGVHVLRDEDLLLRVGRLAPDLLDTRVDLGGSVGDAALAELRSVWRRLEAGHEYKLVVTLLEGSSARDDLEALARYSMEVELCLPVFTRSAPAVGHGAGSLGA